MLVYLSKKIAIPNEVLLNTVAWHRTKGFIACGGDDGLLKVLKLEVTPCKDSALKGLAAPSNLAMNQSLEGHTGHVQVLAWNEMHSKLTSSDQNGLIIVWMLYKGMWHEEMINNRNKSVVRHMQWSKDGSKICIVYEDGAVIVGSVDGTRIWGKELKGMVLTHVQWSPDGRTLLFGNGKGEVQIYDGRGTYNSKLVVQCLSDVTGVVKLAGLEWFGGRDGHIGPTMPSLIVAFDNGRCQFMTHELDDNPVVVNCRMSINCVQWNPDGSLVAMGGNQSVQEGKGLSCVQFYSCFGKLLYVLRVPGRHLCSVSWEGTGLRLALGVGPYIYFANVRHSYKWAYFSNTVVYAFRKPEKVEDCVIFWNVKTGDKQAKTVKNLLSITSCTDFCLLAAVMDDDPKQCTLLLCDALGTPMDTRFVDFEVKFVCMSQTHIVACSSEGVFVWHYRTTSRLITELTHVSTKKGRDVQDRLFHVDLGGGDANLSQTVDFSRVTKPTSDPISSVCCTEKLLVVARDSTVVQVYSLPNLSLVTKQQLSSLAPAKLALNSNSKKMSAVDSNGVLHLYDVSMWTGGGAVDLQAQKLAMERKEVWDLYWARDNADLLAIMEKTRMYIIRGTEPEEPVISSGQICQFDDMHVKSVVLDEIMKDPENPKEDFVFELEIKSLRDTRDLLEKVGLDDAQQFIQDNPHPRLWRLLAESALKQLDLEVAEKAYVMSRNYAGIQFVKRLKMLESEPKQHAEVEAYFMKFDVAEKSYIKMDRRDLALDLRIKFGDWFRVMHIIKSGGAGNDVLLASAWNAIGDYYADSRKWLHAITYYNHARNYKQLAECYYRLEDYNALEGVAAVLPDNDPLLQSLAQKFILVGMCEQAVEIFVKMGDIKAAVDCCMELNQWDLAVDLAVKYEIEEVDSMLRTCATKLLEESKILSAIQLYRKAKRHMEAAKLLHKVAHEARVAGYVPHKLKKLYVLSALEVEDYLLHTRQKRRVANTSSNRKDEVTHTLKGLLAEASSKSVVETEMLNHPWRGAEAYHFFLLTQSLYYSGKFKECLQTAVYLREYDDLLPPVEFYSLLALASAACKAFNMCSKAFIKLESLEEGEVSKERKKLIENLALEIFIRNPPKDMDRYSVTCPSCATNHDEMTSRCSSCDLVFMPCVATGTLLQDYQAHTCTTCKHLISNEAISSNQLKHCPLCHATI